MRACRVTVLWVHRSRLCNVRPGICMVQAPRRSARGARVAGRERRDTSKRPRPAARTETTLPRTRVWIVLYASLSSPLRPPFFSPREIVFLLPRATRVSRFVPSFFRPRESPIPRQVERIIVLRMENLLSHSFVLMRKRYMLYVRNMCEFN